MYVVDHSSHGTDIMLAAAESIGSGLACVVVLLDLKVGEVGTYDSLLEALEFRRRTATPFSRAVPLPPASVGKILEVDNPEEKKRKVDFKADEVECFNFMRQQLRELCARTATPCFSHATLALRDAAALAATMTKGAAMGDTDSGAEIY